MKHLLTFVLLGFLSGYSALCQSSRATKSFLTPNPTSSPIQINRLEKLFEIQQWVVSMRDEKLSAVTLAQIAEAAWTVDEGYSRSLFRIALNKVAVGQNDPEKEINQKMTATRRVITQIAKRDAAWAKALLETLTKDPARKSWSQLEVAMELLSTDPDRAAELAQQSLQTQINQGQVGFIRRLRLQNEERANEMFLQMLGRLLSDPNTDADSFAYLGTYLFRSSKVPPRDGSYIMVLVGSVIMPELSVLEPGVPPALVIAYLRGTITLLQKPTVDLKQRQVKYALGHLMLAKAQESAPNLAGELMAAMAAIANQVPAEYTTGDAYRYVGKKPGSPEDRIAEIEKMGDSYTRDRLYLDVIFQAYRRNDFEIAKVAASKIDHSDIQDQVELLIGFGEARHYLESKEIDQDEAFRRVEKLPESLERCILRLRLAAVAAKSGNKKLEEDMLDRARVSAKIMDDPAGPFILLYISGKLKAKRDLQAPAVFDEAVKLFNKHESIKDFILERPVSLPPLTLRFSLSVTDLKLDFIPMFQAAVKGAEEAAISSVGDIKDERLRGLGYVSLAKSIIAKIPPTPTKGN